MFEKQFYQVKALSEVSSQLGTDILHYHEKLLISD